MKITIELCAGSNRHEPYKQDIDRNIAAVDRAIKGEQLCSDSALLIDTKSILQGIRRELRDSA